MPRIKTPRSSWKKGPRKKLSAVQEEALIDAINGRTEGSHPLQPLQIRELAEAISGEELGRNWVSTFLKRRHSVLYPKDSDPEIYRRIDTDNPKTRRNFHALVAATFGRHEIRPENLYNVNEVMIPLETHKKKRKVAYNGHEPVGEHLTVVACIGVEALIVPPVVIYNGQRMQESWSENTEELARQHEPDVESAWDDDQLMLTWLKDVFDPATLEQSKDAADIRFLFIEPSELHYNSAFIQACMERNIGCIMFPKLMEHRFQPLNLCSFLTRLKLNYLEAMDKSDLEASAQITKGMIHAWHKKAWGTAADCSLIKSGWRDSGLWPFCFEVMCPDDNSRPITPERQMSKDLLETPESVRTHEHNLERLEKGEVTIEAVLEKVSKAYVRACADEAVTDWAIQESKRPRFF